MDLPHGNGIDTSLPSDCELLLLRTEQPRMLLQRLVCAVNNITNKVIVKHIKCLVGAKSGAQGDFQEHFREHSLPRGANLQTQLIPKHLVSLLNSYHLEVGVFCANPLPCRCCLGVNVHQSYETDILINTSSSPSSFPLHSCHLAQGRKSFILSSVMFLESPLIVYLRISNGMLVHET